MNKALEQYHSRLKMFKKYGYDIKKERRFILNKARLKEGSILDIGTGTGHAAAALARSGFKLTSVDIDKDSLKIARQNLKVMSLLKKVKIRRMNAEDLRFKDESFDTVISVNFIHHAENPLKCVHEMARVVKKKIVIADLNKRGEKIMTRVHKLDNHVHEQSKMTLLEIKSVLKKLGMRVKKYRSYCQDIIVAEKEYL
jgi:ubiquinone/menaquinone biosynthesis C-methylase UbiE